jgi:retron-type reverse transcriptase
MTKKSRRKFSAEFKAKVVLEALKERVTIEELARKHELHPTQIVTWKREAMANMSSVFGASVDGKTALTPSQRLLLAHSIKLEPKTKPIRRVWINKPGKTEKRPLGIPTIRERARQTLVKMELEPEWEAKFEPNSYGFRPGRSCHDAAQAIFQGIKFKQAYVLDADIKGCFDNINHQTLLSKLETSPSLRRLIKVPG